MDIYMIYMHRNKVNGKVYIGQTKQTLERRSGKNGNGYKRCKLFFRAIQKYGWENFEHIILVDNLTADMANELEKQYIMFYNSTNPEKGYNLSEGGAGRAGKGHSLTEEHKQKISQSHIGITPSEETKEKLRKSNTGKTLSQETKQKMSERRKNKKSNVSTPVKASTGEIFSSAEEACLWCGLKDGSSVRKVAQGNRQSAGSHPITGERLSWSYCEIEGGGIVDTAARSV